MAVKVRKKDIVRSLALGGGVMLLTTPIMNALDFALKYIPYSHIRLVVAAGLVAFGLDMVLDLFRGLRNDSV